MLDHMILTVSNVERSLAFYEAALKPLNIKFFLPYKGEGGHPDLWGFGDGKKALFWIKQGTLDPASIHWGFMAENNGQVDEFYRVAISAGATNNISPRARSEDPLATQSRAQHIRAEARDYDWPSSHSGIRPSNR
jgi:catechol 2,3-dioxygenase-like lactoylglutathione lyase family enzyme